MACENCNTESVLRQCYCGEYFDLCGKCWSTVPESHKKDECFASNLDELLERDD